MNGGVFDSSILKNNMLSGTSSQKSGDERSYKTSSPEDQRRGERDWLNNDDNNNGYYIWN